ncbi:MAG: VOC family protein [Chloroflexota bacterium]
MKITVTSIPVENQEKALTFYTEILEFVKKEDIPIGDARWLTVVSPEEPDGVELLLEPNGGYPEIKALKEALVRDGIPFTQFLVDDVHAEYKRLKDLGVLFTIDPTNMGTVTAAILDDTCGNLIQIYQMND